MTVMTQERGSDKGDNNIAMEADVRQEICQGKTDW